MSIKVSTGGVFAAAACAALLSMSAPVFANSDNGVQTITNVTLHDSGNAYVTFSVSSNTEVCGTVTGGRTLAIAKTNPNFKLLYAAALAAFLSGHQVDSWASGCVDIWGNGTLMLPQLTLINVQ